jgi:hypothetical protein|tara:strand:- start:618 stop:956 length:339 start_codon:yes stop_codon:yes gene_type:complete
MSWFDILKIELNVGLISDRHEMPVDDYIIEGPVSGKFSLHPDKIYKECWQWLKNNHKKFDTLNVYMTGYGIARDSFLEAFVKFNQGKLMKNKKLYLLNYDEDSKNYIKRRWN